MSKRKAIKNEIVKIIFKIADPLNKGRNIE